MVEVIEHRANALRHKRNPPRAAGGAARADPVWPPAVGVPSPECPFCGENDGEVVSCPGCQVCAHAHCRELVGATCPLCDGGGGQDGGGEGGDGGEDGEGGAQAATGEAAGGKTSTWREAKVALAGHMLEVDPVIFAPLDGNDDGNDDAALGMLFDQPAEFLEAYTRASSASGYTATTHNEKAELAEVMVLALQFYKGEVSQPPRPSAQHKAVYAGDARRFHWVNQKPFCAEFLCRDIDVCGDLQIQREFTPDGKKGSSHMGFEKLWEALQETTMELSKIAVKNRLKTAQHVRAWQWLHQTLEGETNLSASQWLEEASSAAASPAAGAPSSDPEGTPSGDGGGSAVPRSLA